MIRPKKWLGQHFLRDKHIAQGMVGALNNSKDNAVIVEIGPGMGALTSLLLAQNHFDLWVIEIDSDAACYLKRHYPTLINRVIEGDALQIDWRTFGAYISIIGSFPYGISSLLFFKILDSYTFVDEIVCMVQKEVAMRIASSRGKKTYGLLSVLLQAYYTVDFLFEVPPSAFFPSPQVDSAVIRMKRNGVNRLSCDEMCFRKIVKQSFQKRRKILRNALKDINLPADVLEGKFGNMRAEELSVNDFVWLAQHLDTDNYGSKSL